MALYIEGEEAGLAQKLSAKFVLALRAGLRRGGARVFDCLLHYEVHEIGVEGHLSRLLHLPCFEMVIIMQLHAHEKAVCCMHKPLSNCCYI